MFLGPRHDWASIPPNSAAGTRCARCGLEEQGPKLHTGRIPDLQEVFLELLEQVSWEVSFDDWCMEVAGFRVLLTVDYKAMFGSNLE
jgi:hypothetical protein